MRETNEPAREWGGHSWPGKVSDVQLPHPAVQQLCAASVSSYSNVFQELTPGAQLQHYQVAALVLFNQASVSVNAAAVGVVMLGLCCCTNGCRSMVFAVDKSCGKAQACLPRRWMQRPQLGFKSLGLVWCALPTSRAQLKVVCLRCICPGSSQHGI